MKITLNGKETVISDSSNVNVFLGEAGYGDMLVAVAINGTFVPKSLHGETCLAAGDAIEIVAPMQGG